RKWSRCDPFGFGSSTSTWTISTRRGNSPASCVVKTSGRDAHRVPSSLEARLKLSEAKYRAYRDYVDSRVEVDNAMMALLAGSRLASNTLQLTGGSKRTLAELFPAVEHIERFNLRNDSARELLLDADRHLTSVALPYALATHEDFVVSSLATLTAG